MTLLQIAGMVLSALSIVFAAVSVYWVYRIGHSGSKAVWHTTQVKIDKGRSNHEGGETARMAADAGQRPARGR